MKILLALMLVATTAAASDTSPEFDRCLTRLQEYSRLHDESMYEIRQHYYNEYVDPRNHGKVVGKFPTETTGQWTLKARKQADKCMAILDSELESEENADD